MVGDILQPTHLLFILVVALLVLGPKRLPEVGRTLGSGLRDFRQAISGETTPERYERPEPETVYAPPEQRHQPAPEPQPLPAAAPAENHEFTFDEPPGGMPDLVLGESATQDAQPEPTPAPAAAPAAESQPQPPSA